MLWYIRNKLIDTTLLINNKFFFKRKHPFNQYKNWVSDINYADFEYEHAGDFLLMYKDFIDLDDLNWKKTLEIGCWGWWKSLYISKNYSTFSVWIDLNDTFLSQATTKSNELWLEDNSRFIKEDALNMSFKDGEFDYIILSDVLEHIPNTKKLLNESYRVLKKWWVILFDFAPYYHYFWHHLWDTIQIPWLHVFTSEKFRIDLYKKSVEDKIDWDKRIDLRIWNSNSWKESFTYLNWITRKDFEYIVKDFEENNSNVKIFIKYFMIKNVDSFSKIPLLRELLIRHIVWVIKKL